MFLVEFDPKSMRKPSKKKIETLEFASAMDLRYAYFESDVRLSVDGIDSVPFRLTPIIDFMYCLLLSALEVRQGKEGRVSFTENDTLVKFSPTGSELEVSFSWDGKVGHCRVEEFMAGVSVFVDSGLEFITQQYPLFRGNPTYGNLTDLGENLI